MMPDAYDAIKELDPFVDLCWVGIGYAQQATEVAKILAEIRARKDKTEPLTTPEGMEHAKELEKFAGEQLPNGFPFLYRLAALRLWTILEVFVQDTFAFLTTNVPETRACPKIKELEGPVIDFATASIQQQAEMLMTLLLDKTRAGFKPGVARFETMLSAINLDGPVDESVKSGCSSCQRFGTS